MNMDYSICKGLTYNTTGLTDFCIIYDIACQWHRNFAKRVKDSPCLKIPNNTKIQYGIGLFHVHGHQRTCLPRFGPNFIQGLGIVDGEIMETVWSGLNPISGATRTMSKAHKQETLDDHMGYHNWKKLIRIGMYCI